MKKELVAALHKRFEDFAHNEDGVEFWFARELAVLLGYDKWANFEKVVEKAKIACQNAEQSVEDHFADVGKMIGLPKGAQRDVGDIRLTRYACQPCGPRAHRDGFARMVSK